MTDTTAQIRRRRLAKIDEGLLNSSPAKSTVDAPKPASLTDVEKDVSGNETLKQTAARSFEASSVLVAPETPMKGENTSSPATSVKSNVEQSKIDINSSATSMTPQTSQQSTPSRKRDISVSSTSKIVPQSGAKSEIHNLIATNLALESVFLVTYRIEAAHGPVKYIGSAANKDVTEYINHTNVSEIVCTLLSEDTVMGGAVGYLIASYKRLLDKENTVADRVREDLISCRSQVVSFITSALGEPEIFGGNSQTAIADFYQYLCDDTSPAATGLLREISEELHKQGIMTDVVTQLVELCFMGLGAPTALGQMQGPRSILDNVTPALAPLKALARGDKRMAREIALSARFLLESSFAVLGPVPRVHPMIAQMPGASEQHGIAGAAFEHRTLLGRVLRMAPEPREDPKMREMFQDSHRQSRNVVEGNITNLRWAPCFFFPVYCLIRSCMFLHVFNAFTLKCQHCAEPF